MFARLVGEGADPATLDATVRTFAPRRPTDGRKECPRAA
jgi:hypothetical protein